MSNSSDNNNLLSITLSIDISKLDLNKNIVINIPSLITNNEEVIENSNTELFDKTTSTTSSLLENEEINNSLIDYKYITYPSYIQPVSVPYRIVYIQYLYPVVQYLI